MSKFSPETIEKYKQILTKDPNSRAFAVLAEAYRELGLLHEAETIAQNGIKRHPNFAGGYLVLGRVLIAQDELLAAIPVLKKAATLDVQNIMAHQVLANLYLQTRQPKEALRAFKMELFINPSSEKAKRAISKLESLTADEYDAEVFQMKPLSQSGKLGAEAEPETLFGESGTHIIYSEALPDPAELDRALSLVDALIVRNDLLQARESLEELQVRYPDDSRYESRWLLLKNNGQTETAVPIQPIKSREHAILDKKIAVLESILRRIKSVDQT